MLAALQQANALPPTLILTTFDEDHLVIRGMQAGARGFLLKDVSLEQLTDAIRVLARGGTLVQPAIAKRVRQQRQQVQCDFPSAAFPEALSGRELHILRLMARGCSNREIADALTITEGTVKNYVSTSCRKWAYVIARVPS